MDSSLAKTPTRPGLVYPWDKTTPDIGTLIEVAPRLHWVRMPLPFSLKFINLWLAEDEDGWTIIDSGMPLAETQEAWKAILTPRLTADKPLRRVIITHMHPDHIGNAGWLCREYGADLHISRLEYTTCRMLVGDTGRQAPEAGINFYRSAGWDDAALESYKSRFGGFGRAVSQLPDSFYRLEEGGSLNLAGENWHIIIGNGHSPEHACLYCPVLNVVISGDQLLPRISSNVSVHPTEPEANPLADWLASCARLKAALPENVLVLPAHNEPFKGAHKRLQHLIDGHEVALKRLHERLIKGPLRVQETFASLFSRKIGDDEIGLATGEAISHLNCLIARGMARREMDEDGVNSYFAV